MIKKLSAAATALLIASPSMAITGKELLDICLDKVTKNLCITYIAGAIEGFSTFDAYLKHMNITSKENFCLRPNVDATQVSTAFIKFSNANNELQKYPAGILILRATQESFGCEVK